MAAAKIRWGELEEDDGGDLDFLLPPASSSGPTRTGSRRRSSTDSTTTATRSRSPPPPASASSPARASPKAAVERPQLVQGAKLMNQVLLVIHWQWQARVVLFSWPPTSEGPPALGGGGPAKGSYVAPRLRAGAVQDAGHDMKRRNDENSVRVTNLSEDTREPDVLELFRTFGPVSRVYVAVDQRTGSSRGFGFVNFVHREDAEKAISKLNGYGYDNLILHVEWATPRPS
ncbi:hypothetical protein ACQ4PT_021524 [Festuca glaucescens]